MRTGRRRDGVFGPPLNAGVRDGSSGTLEIGDVDRERRSGSESAGRSVSVGTRSNPPTRNLGPALTDRSGLRGPETTTRIVGLHRRFVGESPASPSSLEAPSEPLGSTPIRQTEPSTSPTPSGDGSELRDRIRRSTASSRLRPADATARFADAGVYRSQLDRSQVDRSQVDRSQVDRSQVVRS